MKNELIIARYTGHKKRSSAERLRALLVEFGLEKELGRRFGLVDAVDAVDATDGTAAVTMGAAA